MVVLFPEFCHSFYVSHLIVISPVLLLLLSFTCFGFQLSLSRYISKARMSHFFAFASRVMTRSLSTSSISWSLAIFSIASRKSVSTFLAQGGLHAGFHDCHSFQRWSQVLLHIKCFYSVKSVFVYGNQFLLISRDGSSFCILFTIV